MGREILLKHFSVSQISHRHEFFYIWLHLFFNSLIQSFGILLYILDSLYDLLFKDIASLFYGDIIILQLNKLNQLLVLIFKLYKIVILDLVAIAWTLKLRWPFRFTVSVAFVFGTDRAARENTGCLLAPVGFYHRRVDGVRGLRPVKLGMVFDVCKLLFCRVFGCRGCLRVHAINALLKLKVLVIVIWLRTAPFKRCSGIVGAEAFTSLILYVIQGYVHPSSSFVRTLPLLIERLFEGASLLGLALADSSSFGTLIVLRLGFQSILVFNLSLLLLPFVLLLFPCASQGPRSPIGG